MWTNSQNQRSLRIKQGLPLQPKCGCMPWPPTFATRLVPKPSCIQCYNKLQYWVTKNPVEYPTVATSQQGGEYRIY